MVQHKEVIHPKPSMLLACLANDWPLVQYRTSTIHQSKGWKFSVFCTEKCRVFIGSRFHEFNPKGKIKRGKQQYVDGLHPTYLYVFPNICLRHLFLTFFSRFQEVSDFCAWGKKAICGIFPPENLHFFW